MSQIHLRILAIIGVLLGALLVIPSAGAAASADTDAATKAGVRFTILSTNPDENAPSPMAANGAIHTKGTDVVVDNKHDRFEFPDGTVTIIHKRKKGSANESFDPVTCLFSYSERGTWRVTEGTGAYANAKGRGTYRVQGSGIGCDETVPPEAFYFQIKAVGNLTY